RMLLAPTLDNDLLLGIELDCIATLSVHDTEEALFPSAKREIRHRCGYSNINADVPCWRLIAEAARRRSAGCEERRLVAKPAPRQELHRLVEVLRMDKAQHWTEDFRVAQFA